MARAEVGTVPGLQEAKAAAWAKLSAAGEQLREAEAAWQRARLAHQETAEPLAGEIERIDSDLAAAARARLELVNTTPACHPAAIAAAAARDEMKEIQRETGGGEIRGNQAARMAELQRQVDQARAEMEIAEV